MTNQPLLRKMFTVITSGIMVHLALLSFFTAGLYAVKPLIYPLMTRLPDFCARFMSILYSMPGNPIAFAICCAVSGVCLSISALITLVPLVKRDSVPTGRLIFQKITCIFAYALLIVTLFIGIGSTSIKVGWETALFGYCIFLCCQAFVVVIALLFLISGMRPSSYEIILPATGDFI